MQFLFNTTTTKGAGRALLLLAAVLALVAYKFGAIPSSGPTQTALVCAGAFIVLLFCLTQITVEIEVEPYVSKANAMAMRTHRQELELALIRNMNSDMLCHQPELAGEHIKKVIDALADKAPPRVDADAIMRSAGFCESRATVDGRPKCLIHGEHTCACSSACDNVLPLPVFDPGPDAMEREIQAKASNGPRVTKEDIEAEITHEHYFTAEQGARHHDAVNPRDYGDITSSMKLLTFCVLKLKNGFTVTGESACVSPENFNAEIGRGIARENAVNKIWPLLGFRLRDELARPVLTEADALADLNGTPRPSA